MTNLRLLYVACASALALGVNGCASVQPPAKMVEIRPAGTAPEPPGSAVTNLYQAAVSAIERRDYTRALDLLQDARDRAPQDARVLNAFGVVYDKLGRFDLSGRYYAQAQAADPGSAIVAENRAYSNVLQGKEPLPVLAAQEATPPTAPAPAPAALHPVELATASPPVRSPSPGPVLPAPAARVTLAQIPQVKAAPTPTAQPPAIVTAQAAPQRSAPPPAVSSATPVKLAALASAPAAPSPALAAFQRITRDRRFALADRLPAVAGRSAAADGIDPTPTGPQGPCALTSTVGEAGRASRRAGREGGAGADQVSPRPAAGRHAGDDATRGQDDRAGGARLVLDTIGRDQAGDAAGPDRRPD